MALDPTLGSTGFLPPGSMNSGVVVPDVGTAGSTGAYYDPYIGRWIDPALGGQGLPVVVFPPNELLAAYLSEHPGEGGGGGGGGGGGSGNYVSVYNAFEQYYGVGNVPEAVVRQAAAENWSALKIRQYCMTHGASGPGAIAAIQKIQAIAAAVLGAEAVGAIPEDLYRTLAGEGQDEDYYIHYFLDMPAGDILRSPLAQGMIQTWINMTGIPLTYTAKVKLREIIERHGGATSTAAAEWEAWVPTTQSAWNGNYGAQKRFEINNDFRVILGREATQAEIEQLRYSNAYARLEYMRTTPEYKEMYEFKPVHMTEQQYQAAKTSWTEAYYRAFGIDIGTLGLEAIQNYQPRGTQTVTRQVEVTPTEPPQWKPLTQETFEQELKKYNIKKENGKYYHYLSDGSKEEVAFQDLIKYLPRDEFYYDAQGYHYVQEEGAINPTTGQPAAVTKPRQPVLTTITEEQPIGGPEAFAPAVPKAFLDTMINSGIDPEFWLQSIGWGEDAEVLKARYADTLRQVGITFDDRDWYTLASGAIGSGALRAKIIEAENKVAFRQVFRDYNGRDPSPEDYDYVMSNFVSPTEYAHRMAAKEYALERIDEINELLGRTFGMRVTASDLENLAMGGKGSGALKAKLNQAARLDAFTWTWKQKYGRDPTPEEYRDFLGYTGPEELAWHLELEEKIAELGPEIKEVWNKYYKDSPITDEQLRILLGDMKGSGELKYKLAQAQELEKEEERRSYYRWRSERAMTPIEASAGGGFQLAMPGIGNI